MGHCYTCLYYWRYKLGCFDVCEYNHVEHGGMAQDIPKDKGKLCKNYRCKDGIQEVHFKK